MEIRKELKYTASHEWIRIEGNRAYVGITPQACEKLGEIVFVELPEKDDEFEREDEVCTVESVKAASPIFAPVSGRIVEVNEDLDEAPEKLAANPYQEFIFALEMEVPEEVQDLLDAQAYGQVE